MQRFASLPSLFESCGYFENDIGSRRVANLESRRVRRTVEMEKRAGLLSSRSSDAIASVVRLEKKVERRRDTWENGVENCRILEATALLSRQS